jgi:hypothetical protein
VVRRRAEDHAFNEVRRAARAEEVDDVGMARVSSTCEEDIFFPTLVVLMPVRLRELQNAPSIQFWVGDVNAWGVGKHVRSHAD